MNIQEFRKQYPMYSDMSDTEVATKLYSKSNKSTDFNTFASGMGVNVSIDKDVMRKSESQPMDDSGAGPLDIGLGAAETLATMGTGWAANIPAGYRGIVSAASGESPETVARKVGEVQQALTYEPRTRTGQQTVRGLDETIGQAFRDISKDIGDTAYERFGDSPVAGAAGYSLPTAALEIAGLGAINRLSKGTKLKARDFTGEWQPTQELTNILREQGLTFDQLAPSTIAAIPETLDTGLVPSSRAGGVGKSALEEQARIGGRQDALAPYKVGDGLKKDPLSLETLKQGFEPGLVQMVKTADPSTRFNMLRMLKSMESLKSNLSGANQNRPLNIVGDSLANRLVNLRDVANTSRKELDNIAVKDLRGKEINPQTVSTSLTDALDKFDVTLRIDNETGRVIADYDNSMIVKDPKSQRFIDDVLDLLPQDGAPVDALRAHKIKRQMDALINYGKTTEGGLTEAGRDVMKAVRAGLNNSIREVSTDYARVNDELSSILGAFDSLQTAVGKRVDLFDPETNTRVLGQEMRTLLTNYKRGPMIEQAVKQLDDVSKTFGVKADDNLADLVMFGNALDKQFGAAARGSFQGTMDAALERASEMTGQGLSQSTLTGLAAEFGKDTIQKMRGINEKNAFKALEDLIRRGGI